MPPLKPVCTSIPIMLTPRRKRIAVPAYCCLVVGLHAGLVSWSSYRHSPTVDEPAHLVAGVSYWEFGSFSLYPVNPPLVKLLAAMPVVLCGPQTDWHSATDAPGARSAGRVAQDFISANGQRFILFIRLARWVCLPFTLVGAFCCWHWAEQLYGKPAGLLALTLWCFSPCVIGNASTIASDVPAAACGCAACYAYFRWLNAPKWGTALFAGFTLGVALLTKATWVVLLALWPVLSLCWRPRDWLRIRVLGKRMAQLGLIVLTGLYILNSGYLFQGSFRRLADYEFVSGLMTGFPIRHSYAQPGNRFKDASFAQIPVPFPSHFVRGMDLQTRDFEVVPGSYLHGQWHETSPWYFYFYALCVKVPLGVWVLTFLAIVLTAISRRHREGAKNDCAVVIPAITLMILVCWQPGWYVRYVLPAFPLWFIWISKVARTVKCAQWKTAIIALLATTWFVVSSLAVFPHSLSYFNELAGGPGNGHAHLIDSNIDWGQDLFYLKEWMEQNRHARPIFVHYFGTMPLDTAGIESATVSDAAETLGDEQLRAGWHAISATLLRTNRFAQFLQFDPVATAGYSIYVYHLSCEDVQSFRNKPGQ